MRLLHDSKGAYSGRGLIGVQGLLLSQGLTEYQVAVKGPRWECFHEDMDGPSRCLPAKLKLLT